MYVGQFFEKKPNFLGSLFPRKKYVQLIFTKIGIATYIWAIFSKAHLVPLTETKVSIKTDICGQAG
jgi:hypothetical protein